MLRGAVVTLAVIPFSLVMSGEGSNFGHQTPALPLVIPIVILFVFLMVFQLVVPVTAPFFLGRDVRIL